MSHSIDLTDQYASFDSGITQFNLLRFSGWLNNPIIPFNRLRVSDYRLAFSESGFQVVDETSLSGDPAGIGPDISRGEVPWLFCRGFIDHVQFVCGNPSHLLTVAALICCFGLPRVNISFIPLQPRRRALSALTRRRSTAWQGRYGTQRRLDLRPRFSDGI
jgi:hypothetical protein